MNQSILFVITGGTIDKDYNPLTGELTFESSHLPNLIKQANCTLDIEFNVTMLKDSLEMTDHDREMILQSCHKSTHTKIVISHGTDTMTKTAQYLKNSGQLKDKTIVITGAMRPYMLGNSDSEFNVGTALSAVQLAENGIYICMNGQVIKGSQANKNRSLGVFETIE